MDFDLIETQFRHLMRVAVFVREGAISSSTLLKRLRSGSRKNATCAAFREVGRVIRTVQFLRYLSDAPLRRRVTAVRTRWLAGDDLHGSGPVYARLLPRGSASNTVAWAGI
ncbi:Tn3 family transposase [Streptomyces sp. NPDC052051]|uniref:Tn3 family transposase n=1 Tax=Streptomyces sp. NPDC052051 TaxID=3154649 RepID=UPI00342E33AC